MYTCVNCGKAVETDLKTAKKVICPFCGYRVIKKSRPPVIKKVRAV
jgi:DNA-directed RNA polymerase subunit RPC12/RpoP